MQTEAMMKYYFRLTQAEIDGMTEAEYADTVAQVNYAIRKQIEFNGLKIQG